ncbi:MAG: HAMP domain-containing sensor histidine kinase [Burkholderiaceae bacterium]
MTQVLSHDIELAELATYIAQQREAILRAWSSAVATDPTLTTGTSLPRAQLHDHIPALLVDYERALADGQHAKAADVQDTQSVQRGDAAAHGLHRWQQGYDLAEVTRELDRLNECVVVELENYAAARPALHHGVMAAARTMWAKQFGAAISASTSQYFRLQQIEARSHIKDLEQALETLRELERQQAELWQEAAHDLRGNLGAVTNVAAGLTSTQASDVARASFLRLLDRNLRALNHLLNDVTSLARLQGGQEHRAVQPLDAAMVLRDLCERLEAQAQAHQLFLRFDGPRALPVTGYEVKIRRIAQNLVLNAIKYTRQGGVTVSWGEADDDAQRWFLQVQDTGPGFDLGPGTPLAGALVTATDQARQVACDEDTGEVSHPSADLAAPPDSAAGAYPAHQTAGEGLGLSIVKRLCELLDATVELDSRHGVGTVFRVLLPQGYAD